MNHRRGQRMGFHREQNGMTRVDIETGIPFEEFVAALEKAAPPVDQTTLERISASGGNWDDVRATAAAGGPRGAGGGEGGRRARGGGKARPNRLRDEKKIGGRFFPPRRRPPP